MIYSVMAMTDWYSLTLNLQTQRLVKQVSLRAYSCSMLYLNSSVFSSSLKKLLATSPKLKYPLTFQQILAALIIFPRLKNSPAVTLSVVRSSSLVSAVFLQKQEVFSIPNRLAVNLTVSPSLNASYQSRKSLVKFVCSFYVTFVVVIVTTEFFFMDLNSFYSKLGSLQVSNFILISEVSFKCSYLYSAVISLQFS